jgi:hypothetical protein
MKRSFKFNDKNNNTNELKCELTDLMHSMMRARTQMNHAENTYLTSSVIRARTQMNCRESIDLI